MIDTSQCRHQFAGEHVFTAWFIVELVNGETWLGTTCENDCGAMLLRHQAEAIKARAKR